MERGGQVLDELAEVHALVGDIVENGLVAIALILHVANLHVEAQVFGYLAALDHRAVLAGLGLAVLVHVDLARMTIHAANVVGRLDVGLLNLQVHQTARQRHHTDVVAGIGFHGNDIALLQVEVVYVVVVSLARILELHLYEVGLVGVARHVGQPVVGVQLSVLASAGLAAESSVAAAGYLEFHVFEVHT